MIVQIGGDEYAATPENPVVSMLAALGRGFARMLGWAFEAMEAYVWLGACVLIGAALLYFGVIRSGAV